MSSWRALLIGLAVVLTLLSACSSGASTERVAALESEIDALVSAVGELEDANQAAEARLELYAQVIANGGDIVTVRAGKFELVDERGTVRAGERTCLEILERAPGDPRAWTLLIRVRRFAGRYDEALRTADQALGKLGEALQSFRRVTELNPEYPEGQYGLGKAYYKNKSYAEARTAWQIVVEIAGTDYKNTRSLLAAAEKKLKTGKK